MADYTLSMTAAQADAAITANVGITTTPTAGSAKTVTSGGVKTYVDTSVNTLGAKVTKTVNGATTQNILFTKSFAGTISMPGDSVTGSTAHGLGAQPFFFNAYLKCKVANNGYNIGDLAVVANGSSTPTVWADATNIYVRTNGTYVLVDADGGSTITATSTNFDVEFRAFL